MTQPEPWEARAPQTTADLEAQLAGFIGTTRYYRNFIGLLYTEGVRQMAELARAYWLIDVVASYQPQVRVPFQLWHIGSKDHRAIVTMREDSRLPVLVEQRIPFTDFPEGSLELYCAQNVLMLKSEDRAGHTARGASARVYLPFATPRGSATSTRQFLVRPSSLRCQRRAPVR